MCPHLSNHRFRCFAPNTYIVRVPNDCWNGGTGRRWYAIANGYGLGHFKSKKTAIAALLKTTKSRT